MATQAALTQIKFSAGFPCSALSVSSTSDADSEPESLIVISCGIWVHPNWLSSRLGLDVLALLPTNWRRRGSKPCHEATAMPHMISQLDLLFILQRSWQKPTAEEHQGHDSRPASHSQLMSQLASFLPALVHFAPIPPLRRGDSCTEPTKQLISSLQIYDAAAKQWQCVPSHIYIYIFITP